FWQRVDECELRSTVWFHRCPSRAQLTALYQGAICFALPSDEEGFGMVLIEAMSCGVPVVATRCGGPEGIITDGVDGFLVPLNDPDTMAGRLCELITSAPLNGQMGAAARHAVETRFSESAAGNVFLQTYEELLRQQSSRKGQGR